MKRTLLIALLTSAVMTSSCVNDKNGVRLEYEKYTLENGLQVVLHQDKSDPVVSVALQYNVGAKNERPGKTGFAHFFEHMLFQRSENLPRNAFFQKIDEMGGSFNGMTSMDGTIYFETVPRDALEKVLWMESDRLGFFINTVTQGGLEREIDVVSNEKRQGENAPYGMTFEILTKSLFPPTHPYGHSVIGEIADLRGATVEDVLEFYDKYYSPANATLAIAGDFDVKQVKELVEKYFGEIPARPAPAKLEVQNVTLDNTKKIYYEDAFAGTPLIMVAYSGTEAYSKDGYALDFLSNILSADKKSPLYKVLVEEKKLMSDIYMYSSQMQLAGIIAINGTTFPGVDLDDVYAGIQEAFERFEKDGVNPKDLERYKLQEEMNVYSNLTSVDNKARTLAHNNVFTGTPDHSVRDLKNYNAVTPEDVMRVYEKYIKGQNSVIISVVPTGQAELAVTGSVVSDVKPEPIEEQTLASEGGAIIDDPYEKTPSRFDRSIEPPLMSNTPELSIPEIWTAQLPGGMIIKGIGYTELPLVYFAIELNSGMLLDAPDKVGLANLTARMLKEGTEFKTPEELDEAIGQLGASINVFSSGETMTLSGSCLKEKFEGVVDLVEEMLAHPRWDEKAFAINKERMLDEINQNNTLPNYIGTTVFRKLLFGSESILAYASIGTTETVQSLTMDDVKGFYSKNMAAASFKMSYVGGHTKPEVERIIGAATSKMPAIPARELPDFPKAPTAYDAKLYFVDYPGARQSYIVMGSKSMPASSPDASLATVVNDRLGAGSSSLLFEILRLERGYTYGAYSNFVQSRHINFFTAQSSVQATVTSESVGLFRDIIGGYGSTYTEANLGRTKNSMLRKMAGAFETPNSLVNMVRAIFVLGKPENYVKMEEETLKTMSMADAQRIINQYLNYDDMIFVVVGDAATQLEPLRRSLGEKVVQVDANGKPI